MEYNLFFPSIFLFGSRSSFNSMCHQIITDLKEKYPHIKRVSYTCKSETCVLEKEKNKWEELYSTILKKDISLLCFEEEVEHKNKYTANKASYIERNQSMIDSSDFCIFYCEENYLPEIRKFSKNSAGFYQPNSGTKLALNYAKRKKKNIINVKEFEPYNSAINN